MIGTIEVWPIFAVQKLDGIQERVRGEELCLSFNELEVSRNTQKINGLILGVKTCQTHG